MKEEYGLIEEKKPKHPIRKLLRVPHQGKVLTVSYPPFGTHYEGGYAHYDGWYFDGNVREMQKRYLHPQTGKVIRFREPTTAESISAAAYYVTIPYGLERDYPPNLQLGRIIKTGEGVFANPPRDARGKLITDEQTLKAYLDGAEKVNGIWRLENDFGFAPYETFKQEHQEAGDFAEGGLARLLEYTVGTAIKLKKLASRKNHLLDIIVEGFDPEETPHLIDTTLKFDIGVSHICILGEYWHPGDKSGFAFGVLKEREEDENKK